jgi:hypothetical protein
MIATEYLPGSPARNAGPLCRFRVALCLYGMLDGLGSVTKLPGPDLDTDTDPDTDFEL